MKVGDLLKFSLRRIRIGFYAYGKAEPEVVGTRGLPSRGMHMSLPQPIHKDGVC